MYHLGVILKSLRDERGYTQGQVAKKINVSIITVGRWENDERLPSTEHLIDLAILYNVSLNYLLGIDKEKSIVIDGLSDRQKAIMNSLLLEFTGKRKKGKELTQKQQEILGILINEFNS